MNKSCEIYKTKLLKWSRQFLDIKLNCLDVKKIMREKMDLIFEFISRVLLYPLFVHSKFRISFSLFCSLSCNFYICIVISKCIYLVLSTC